MKTLLQWARLDATDWIPLDLEIVPTAWRNLPTRPEPAPGQLGGTNNVLGWINNLMVQGVRFNGADHYSVEQVTVGLELGIRVTIWNDDPDDWPVGQRHARVWTFLPLAADPNLGGAINTRQTQVLYAEGERFLRIPPQNTTVLPWADFVPPASAIIRHGVQLTDAKYAEHLASQTEWGWRHWVDHLPDSEVVTLPDGRRELKVQRDLNRWPKAQGTITYFQRDTDRNVGYITATHEDALELTTATAVSESVTTDADVVAAWAFDTPANEPNSADWPNGVYRIQLDCTVASAGIVYGVDTFSRVTADLTSRLENWTPVNGDGDFNDFSGTGLKLAAATVDPAAGLANNCFGIVIQADGDSHGDAITLRLNTADAFADGPWGNSYLPQLRRTQRAIGVR